MPPRHPTPVASTFAWEQSDRAGFVFYSLTSCQSWSLGHITLTENAQARCGLHTVVQLLVDDL